MQDFSEQRKIFHIIEDDFSKKGIEFSIVPSASLQLKDELGVYAVTQF